MVTTNQTSITHKKIIQVRKEEVKLSLFSEDMTLHRENPNDATKKTIRTH